MLLFLNCGAKQDLVVLGVPGHILLNDGTGNFTKFEFYVELEGNLGNCFDATGDGHMDLLTLGDGRQTLTLGDGGKTNYYMNRGAWPIELHSGGGDATNLRDETKCMLPVDVDGDGDMVRLSSLCTRILVDVSADVDFSSISAQDLIVCTFTGPDKLLLNDGVGNFALKEGAFDGPSGGAVPPATMSGTLLDANGDGHVDVFFSHFLRSPPSTKNELFLGDGQGNFEYKYIEEGGLQHEGDGSVQYSISADFNGDGNEDLYLFNGYITLQNSLWLNDGTGSFTKKDDLVQRPGGSAIAAVAVDVDSDGDMDLFVAGHAGTTCVLYINDGSGHFTYQSASGETSETPIDFTSVAGSWSAVVAEDFDGNGFVDLFVSAKENVDPPNIFLNNGDGTFIVKNLTELTSALYGDGVNFADHGTKYVAVDIDQDGDGELAYYLFFPQLA